MKKAIILSIGNELTSGQSVDTNSAWLSIQLGQLGITTIAHHTIADDINAITTEIKLASDNAEIVIVTGGLGPTPDDLTRDAIAKAMGVKLELHEPSLTAIETMFKSWSRTMADSNVSQAMLPHGATALPNTQGTAPGILAHIGNADVYITPGVPREMKAMFEASIAPNLGQSDNVILHEIVHLFGLGESTVGEMLDDIMSDEGPVTVGTTVAACMVSVRIISSAASLALAQSQVEETVETIIQRCGQNVVGVGNGASMSLAIGELLTNAGQTLATAESCTGGLIGKLMTDISGSSSYYLGGVVSYANEAKRDLLGVDEKLLIAHGAVSEEVAGAMAIGAREKLSADWAVSTTGIAGPTGGTDEKPVGLVYTALAGADGYLEVRKNVFSAKNRETVRLRAALTALDMLRRKLISF